MIKQGNKVISNTQIKILSSNEITKETIENVLTGEIVSHTHDGTYVKKDDPRLSDSRPASDVSAWAKASIKPSYSASEITGLSNVAKTGSYNDLSNKPTIPTVDVNKAYVDGALATKADLVSGKIPLSQLPEIPSPITIDSSLSSTSTNPVQNKVINTALGNKVDKVSGKGLSTNDYTTTEKNKLSRIGWIVYRDPSIEYEKGSIVFSTYSIDPNSGSSNKSSFDIRGADSSSSGIMTASDKNKLDGIATGANNYIHPATSGNKHIPAGGASGQILRWGSDGTAVWGADNNTTYSVVGANGSTGLVKNGSSVTNASGYTTCPIIGGVPYYKDTTYTLPTATGSILGGVKTGANITNSSGTISITKSNITSALGYTPEKECLLIEYIDMVGSTTPETITETQFNDIWNAIKNNESIKVKYSQADIGVYITADCVYGLCYGPEFAQCIFGSLHSDAKDIIIEIQKQDTKYTLACSADNGVISTDGSSDMFLANDGTYRFLPKVSTTQNGIVNVLPDDATKFLDGKGNWSTVSTVLKPGVSDIFKRIGDAGEGGTVTQAEWDILVAATPEIDKTYFFSVTEEFINEGIGMCYDKGVITRTTSSVDMLINGILPQYLVGMSVDATTKACSMIAYASTIAGGSNGLSISSVVSDGNNPTSCGLTLKTNGDGSKALMDNGSYKPVSSDYIIDYLDISGGTGEQTFTITEARYNEIKTAFENKRNIILYVFEGLGFYRFTSGINFGETFIFTTTHTSLAGNNNTQIDIYTIELVIELPVNTSSKVTYRNYNRVLS
ncbi:hypothetical protein [Parabacteroides distasonis]|uniref:hypothetical protein n=1 Tax=Parabacteroides distasonis TaxID=823 RepID=UPI0039B59710